MKILSFRKYGSFFGDVEEIFHHKAENQGIDSAQRWYRREVLGALPAVFLESLRWRWIMLKSDLKTAARMFRKDPGYSFLNTAGLAVGLACFTVLAMWVRQEIAWDRFHANAPLIHRLESNSPAQPGPLGPYLKAHYPEIAESVRFSYKPVLMKAGDKAIEEEGFVLADPSVFDVFTVPFVAGNRDSAFSDPDTVVLTEAAAEKYFGDENPVGRILTVEDRFDVRVTGVVRNPPDNSDIQFAVLGEFGIVGRFRKDYETHWGNHEYLTYVRLAPGADAAAVIPRIARVVKDRDPSIPSLLTMKPLLRIHLYEDGAVRFVAIFALVAVFILAVAACNFINLTTARSAKRAKEIAVRKVSGAVRSQLVRQFLAESVFLSMAAFAVSLASVAAALPAFNSLTGKHFGPADLFQPGLFFFLLGTAAAVGISSGAYPAFLLSSFSPTGLLKGGIPRTGRSSGRDRLRKILVVAQFAVSIVLIISTLFVSKQVGFIRNYDLGIRKENILVLPAKAPVIAARDAFVGELIGRPGVVNATFVSSLPSNVSNFASGMEWEGKDAGSQPSWLFVATDERYLDTLGLTLLDGRNFADGRSVKEVPAFLINQRAADEMKLRNPVGSRFSLWGWNGTVRGVIGNFHTRPLREELQPLLVFIHPGIYNYVLVKIKPGDAGLPAILDRIKGVWEKFAPGIPFSYEFLDASFDRNYRAETNLGREFKSFAFLGIFISCLGLVGLTAAVVEQKRKEIGIRKVLGSSVPGILRRINGEFLGPVLLSNLIAWPVGFWAMKTWLRGFVYHANLSAGVFLAAAGAALVIALATVSVQSFRAARENPVRALKNE